MANSVPAIDGDLLQKRLPIPARDQVTATSGELQLTSKSWTSASLFGWSILVLFLVVFGGWSYVAPLASAVRAQGKLHVVSEEQVIQHFEGGIVKEILVHEGQMVEQGQVLVKLDPLQTESQYAQLQNQILTLLAERARLEAERDDRPEIEFPERILSQIDDPQIAALVARETNLFEKTRRSTNDQKALVTERIGQLQTQIRGSVERLESTRRQIEIVEEELDGVRALYEKGLERKPRLLALERGKESLRGTAGQLEALIAQLKQEISEQRLRLEAFANEREREISDRLRANAVRLVDFQEQENVWRDRRERIQVKAPRSGQVVNMSIHTLNGVIRPAEPLMTIVPLDDELIVTAKIKQKDVDVILVGAPVQLQLAAFNPRITPPIEGTLTSVSADVVRDERGQEFFEARISIDPDSLSQNLPGVKLTAGMTVSALISVGERTLFEYIVTPLSQSLNQAMREP
ncbi:MAG: HlyD family type I secretion periplasmic adaptor subunit [Nisaea sp.]|uniref:HlyD family type I secretion periplasmic adaptor subunit n=1 Tax=Nisaea sp. TaxID=2024842 RepID=UPI001B14C86D|nr:HlyD family type I secretion periplasmic adaptor subunit [Nisaea sp.]MBO6562211.1 HlyD family type I secretion periplasmic adaptor subunit [Nisaea sp.]